MPVFLPVFFAQNRPYSARQEKLTASLKNWTHWIVMLIMMKRAGLKLKSPPLTPQAQ